MGAPEVRPRVYVQLRVGKTTMARVLDLAYIDGRPAAIRSWVVLDGRRVPGVYHLLDPKQLTVSAPVGCWWYNGVVEDRP